MGWFNNSFSPMLGPNDIKIEFDGSVYFQVIDPDTGEETYLKIDSIIGQETKEVPKVGDYILSEERIMPEIEVKEEKKKSLWDEEFKIDLDEDSSSWDKVVDRLCEIGEVYPITKEELEEIYKINYMNDWEVDKDYIESYKEWNEEVAYNLGLITKDGVVVGVR